MTRQYRAGRERRRGQPGRTLGELLPWMKALPRPLSPARLDAVREAVAQPRGRRYRRAWYVCSKRHTLAEVVALPDGPALLVYGLVDHQWRPSGVPRSLTEALDPRVDLSQRSRAKSWGIRLADLSELLDAAPGASPVIEPACRCGRHSLDLSDVEPESESIPILLPRAV